MRFVSNGKNANAGTADFDDDQTATSQLGLILPQRSDNL